MRLRMKAGATIPAEPRVVRKERREGVERDMPVF
jgi:hypothetical protein